MNNRERSPERFAIASWRQDALCIVDGVGTDFFFGTDKHEVEAAIEFCSDCPVKTDCLEYAITNNIVDGVWGGASERERRRMKRSLKSSDL